MPNVFIEAIKNNDYARVFEILNENPKKNLGILNVEYDPEYGFLEAEVPAIPLHLAIYLLNPELVILLLDKGADANFISEFYRETPLDCVIANHNISNDEMFLRQMDIIEALYYYGANINKENIILCTVRSIERGRNNTRPIEFDEQIITSLVNKYTVNNLILLIQNGDIEGVSEILSMPVYIKHPYRDENVFQCNIDLNMNGGIHGSAILYAAEFETSAMLALLYEKGAKLDHIDSYQNNVFHYAARQGRLETIEWLSQTLSPETRKRLINSPEDVHGNTPLHLAAKYNHVKTVEKLLLLGAKKEIKNKENVTAETQPNLTPDVSAIFHEFRQDSIPTLRWMCVKKIVKQNLSVSRIKSQFPEINGLMTLAKTGKRVLDNDKKYSFRAKRRYTTE